MIPLVTEKLKDLFDPVLYSLRLRKASKSYIFQREASGHCLFLMTDLEEDY